MIIVGGANGAGKTTFVKEYLEEHKDVIYLSADAIAEELSPNNMSSVRIEAGRIFRERIIQFINQKANFLVESTLSGNGLIRDITKANSLGTETKLLYIFHESVDVCINRVRERVLAGGHDVPIDDIIRRYTRSLENFWYKYKEVVDIWHLMYNSDTGFGLVCDGKKSHELNIVDANLYKLFQEVIDYKL